MIVLDDVWSTEAWGELKNFFPDNGSRSRIVVTTRLSYVASVFSSSTIVIELLDMDKSWKLFCTKMFGEEEDCPLELVEIGKKIVEQCRGLPLSIVVVAVHLGKCSRSNKQWVDVAEDMISFLNSGEEQCLSILSLSYSHLPIFLKPCFIYMGIFPEDEDILVSTLIRLWVAEGFLRSNGDRSPEQIAEGYLKDLVERNLISVESKGQFEEVLTCNTHDLLRELCLKVAKEEKFFCVLKHPAATSRCCTNCPMNHNGRYSIDNSRLRRILSQPEDNWDKDELNLHGQFATSQYFNMRYTFGCVSWQQKVNSIPVAGLHPSVWKPYCFNLPSSISLQWNLQTIVLRGNDAKFLAPCEIWEMPQLRHVDISHLILPTPPADDDADVVVMQKLRTLLVVDNLKLCEDVYRRIPNLQELQIHYNLEESSSFDYYYQDHLRCFDKLESLTLNFYERSDWRGFAMYITFPRSLKELRLESSSLRWEDLSTIGSLPHLEVLALTHRHSVKGEEWNPNEGEFRRLKSLTIRHCYDLVRWNVEWSHFPVLETLTLRYAFELGELPSGIGDIPTLGRIYLDRCSMLAAISAMRMLIKQHELGNDELQLTIQFSDGEELEIVKEIAREEGLERRQSSSQVLPVQEYAEGMVPIL